MQSMITKKKSCSFLVQRYTPLEEKEQVKRPRGVCIRRKMKEGQGHQFVVIVFLPFCKPEGQEQGTNI